MPRRAHRDLPRCFAPRNAKAPHEAARVPPMDSRDNRQHRIRHQQVVPSYSGAVAPIYSGVDTIRRCGRPVRAWHFACSWENLAKRPATSPPRTWCLDIFSPLPGDNDVTSHVVRLSPYDTKIALRSLRTEARSSDTWSIDDMVTSTELCCDTTLKSGSQSTPWNLQPPTASHPPRHFQTRPSRRLGRVASIGSLRPFDCRF